MEASLDVLGSRCWDLPSVLRGQVRSSLGQIVGALPGTGVGNLPRVCSPVLGIVSECLDLGLESVLVDQDQVLVGALGSFGAPRQDIAFSPRPPHRPEGGWTSLLSPHTSSPRPLRGQPKEGLWQLSLIAPFRTQELEAEPTPKLGISPDLTRPRGASLPSSRFTFLTQK